MGTVAEWLECRITTAGNAVQTTVPAARSFRSESITATVLKRGQLSSPYLACIFQNALASVEGQAKYNSMQSTTTPQPQSPTSPKESATKGIGEVGTCPHSEACTHTLLFEHRVISG